MAAHEGSEHASIAAARDARDREHRDELVEIGGEFGFSRATQSYYAGFILSELSEAASGGPVGGSAVAGSAVGGSAVSGSAVGGRAAGDEVVTELEGAIGLYATGPGPGEHHSRYCHT